MKRTSPRAEPISIHLERHRDCLKRRCAEHGIAAPAAGDWNDLAPFDGHGRPGAVLPFERPDDDD